MGSRAGFLQHDRLNQRPRYPAGHQNCHYHSTVLYGCTPARMSGRITFVAAALLVLAASVGAVADVAPTKGDIPRRSLRQHDVQIKKSFDFEFQKGSPPKKADDAAAPPPADAAPAPKPETVYLVADSKCGKCGKTYKEYEVAKVVTKTVDAPPPKKDTPPAASAPPPPPPPPEHPLLAKLAAIKSG